MIEEGNVMPVTLTGPALSSGVVVAGSLVGVAATSGNTGDTISVALRGVFAVAKGGAAITQGTRLYWDAAANNGLGQVATVAGSLPTIGYAFTPAAAADATVNVKLAAA